MQLIANEPTIQVKNQDPDELENATIDIVDTDTGALKTVQYKRSRLSIRDANAQHKVLLNVDGDIQVWGNLVYKHLLDVYVVAAEKMQVNSINQGYEIKRGPAMQQSADQAQLRLSQSVTAGYPGYSSLAFASSVSEGFYAGIEYEDAVDDHNDPGRQRHRLTAFNLNDDVVVRAKNVVLTPIDDNNELGAIQLHQQTLDSQFKGPSVQFGGKVLLPNEDPENDVQPELSQQFVFDPYDKRKYLYIRSDQTYEDLWKLSEENNTNVVPYGLVIPGVLGVETYRFISPPISQPLGTLMSEDVVRFYHQQQGPETGLTLTASITGNDTQALQIHHSRYTDLNYEDVAIPVQIWSVASKSGEVVGEFVAVNQELDTERNPSSHYKAGFVVQRYSDAHSANIGPVLQGSYFNPDSHETEVNNFITMLFNDQTNRPGLPDHHPYMLIQGAVGIRADPDWEDVVYPEYGLDVRGTMRSGTHYLVSSANDNDDHATLVLQKSRGNAVPTPVLPNDSLGGIVVKPHSESTTDPFEQDGGRLQWYVDDSVNGPHVPTAVRLLCNNETGTMGGLTIDHDFVAAFSGKRLVLSDILQLRESGGDAYLQLPQVNTKDLHISPWDNDNAIITATHDHRVGICNKTPAATLDVDGSVLVSSAIEAQELELHGALTAEGNITAKSITLTSAGNSERYRPVVDFKNGYIVFSDNVGDGSDNTRLWFQGPEGGEMIFGPRTGSQTLDRMRFRSKDYIFEDGHVSVESTSVTGEVSAGSATVSGEVSAASASVTGELSAGSALVTGELSTESASVTDGLSAGSASVTGNLSAESATVSGELSAGSASVTDGLSAGTASVIGNLSAGSASVTGGLSAGTATVTGALSTNTLSAETASVTGVLTAGNVVLDGELIASKVREWINTQVESAGWYRIASNGPLQANYLGEDRGSRAFARFLVYDINTAHHGIVEFIASCSYGRTVLQILHSNDYGSDDEYGSIEAVRVISGSTYDGCAVELYLKDNASVFVAMFDNEWKDGWTFQNFTAGELPDGFREHKVDFTQHAVKYDIQGYDAQRNAVSLFRVEQDPSSRYIHVGINEPNPTETLDIRGTLSSSNHFIKGPENDQVILSFERYRVQNYQRYPVYRNDVVGAIEVQPCVDIDVLDANAGKLQWIADSTPDGTHVATRIELLASDENNELEGLHIDKNGRLGVRGDPTATISAVDPDYQMISLTSESPESGPVMYLYHQPDDETSHLASIGFTGSGHSGLRSQTLELQAPHVHIGQDLEHPTLVIRDTKLGINQTDPSETLDIGGTLSSSNHFVKGGENNQVILSFERYRVQDSQRHPVHPNDVVGAIEVQPCVDVEVLDSNAGKLQWIADSTPDGTHVATRIELLASDENNELEGLHIDQNGRLGVRGDPTATISAVDPHYQMMNLTSESSESGPVMYLYHKPDHSTSHLASIGFTGSGMSGFRSQTLELLAPKIHLGNDASHPMLVAQNHKLGINWSSSSEPQAYLHVRTGGGSAGSSTNDGQGYHPYAGILRAESFRDLSDVNSISAEIGIQAGDASWTDSTPPPEFVFKLNDRQNASNDLGQSPNAVAMVLRNGYEKLSDHEKFLMRDATKLFLVGPSQNENLAAPHPMAQLWFTSREPDAQDAWLQGEAGICVDAWRDLEAGLHNRATSMRFFISDEGHSSNPLEALTIIPETEIEANQCRVGINDPTPEATLDVNGSLKSAQHLIEDPGIRKNQTNEVDTDISILEFRRSRYDHSNNAQIDVQAGDEIGMINFVGWKNKEYQVQNARIECKVDSAYNPSAHYHVPTTLQIMTKDIYGEARGITMDSSGRVGIRTNPVYELDVGGDARLTGLLQLEGGDNDADKLIDFDKGYQLYVDNTGSGTDSTRLWLDGPDQGEMILGPRSGSAWLDRIRLRGNTVLTEGIAEVTDFLKLHGGDTKSDKVIDFNKGYALYADNEGSGDHNSRLWLDAPDQGEIIFGPRLGSNELDQFRIKANNVRIDGSKIRLSDGMELISTGGLTWMKFRDNGDIFDDGKTVSPVQFPNLPRKDQIKESDSTTLGNATLKCIRNNYGTQELGNETGYIYMDYITFTGVHFCFWEDAAKATWSLEQEADYFGYIVISTGKPKNYKSEFRDAITIQDAKPTVEFSSKPYDKRVYGVLGADRSSFHHEVGINSLGEGAIWVCDEAGGIENGDYIVSSSEVGIGMKQDDDLLHNYTVAKAVMDCSFETDPSQQMLKDGTTYACHTLPNGRKAAFIACTYHCG